MKAPSGRFLRTFATAAAISLTALEGVRAQPVVRPVALTLSPAHGNSPPVTQPPTILIPRADSAEDDARARRVVAGALIGAVVGGLAAVAGPPCHNPASGAGNSCSFGFPLVLAVYVFGGAAVGGVIGAFVESEH